MRDTNLPMTHCYISVSCPIAVYSWLGELRARWLLSRAVALWVWLFFAWHSGGNGGDALPGFIAYHLWEMRTEMHAIKAETFKLEISCRTGRSLGPQRWWRWPPTSSWWIKPHASHASFTPMQAIHLWIIVLRSDSVDHTSMAKFLRYSALLPGVLGYRDVLAP